MNAIAASRLSPDQNTGVRTQAQTEFIEACLEALSNVLYLADHAKDLAGAKRYFGQAQAELAALYNTLLTP